MTVTTVNHAGLSVNTDPHGQPFVKHVFLDYEMQYSENTHSYDITSVLDVADVNSILGAQVWFRDVYTSRIHLDTASHSVEFRTDANGRIWMTIAKDTTSVQYHVRVLLTVSNQAQGRGNTAN
ncbi:hypothetical protein GGF32_006782 [Allomyces javanicus]|nr:hypothetical protein GGF32_006782 [Allomyces javanicus]